MRPLHLRSLPATPAPGGYFSQVQIRRDPPPTHPLLPQLVNRPPHLGNVFESIRLANPSPLPDGCLRLPRPMLEAHKIFSLDDDFSKLPKEIELIALTLSYN